MLKQIFLILLIITYFSSLKSQETGNSLNRLDSLTLQEKVDYYNQQAWKLRNKNVPKGLEYVNKALSLSDSINYFKGQAAAHNYKGVLYRNLGFYNLALVEYQKAVDISEKHSIKKELGYGYNNLGNLYLYQELPELAINHLEYVIKIAGEIHNKDMEAYAWQNIGRSYLLLNKPDSARYYINKAIQIRKELKLFEKLGVSYKYLGDTYLVEHDYDKAEQAYFMTEKLNPFENDLDLFSDYCLQKAKIAIAKNQLDSAAFWARKSLETAKKVHTLFRIKNAYEVLSRLMSLQKNYRKAFLYSQQAIAYRDSLYNEQLSKRIQSIEFNSEQQKKQTEIMLLKKDLQITEANNERNKLLLLGLLILVAVFTVAFVGYYRSREKIKKANQALLAKNKEIVEKNKQLKESSFELSVQSQNLHELNNKLEDQKKTLVKRQNKITDSIQYASRIQAALMPQEDLFKTIFKDYFVFNKARDIVSGDFFWLKHHKNDIYLAVADCTGHGVSGAFISVLGISLLNEEIHHIIDKGINITTGQILDNLRLRLKNALRQRSIKDNKDGLDISLVKINKKEKRLQFSAAYNNTYIFENSSMRILEADRMPISIHLLEKKFNTTDVQWSESIKLYLATDGFQDQIGEKTGRKYFTKRFRKLLMNISNLSFPEQKQFLEKEFILWKGNKKQIDDILIVGVEI